MEQFITEAGDLHLKLLTENGHRQRIAILCKALTSAYTLGKEAGMQEEAINCHDHCEKAKEEMKREVMEKHDKDVRKILIYIDQMVIPRDNLNLIKDLLFLRISFLLTNPKTEESYPFMNDPSRGGGGGH